MDEHQSENSVEVKEDIQNNKEEKEELKNQEEENIKNQEKNTEKEKEKIEEEKNKEKEEDQKKEEEIQKISNKHKQKTSIQYRTKDEMEFQDEVDTPIDIPAKERFKKYRGLDSMKTGSWNPLINLPKGNKIKSQRKSQVELKIKKKF